METQQMDEHQQGRTAKVLASFTQQEHQRLSAEAYEAGLPLATYVRERALGRKPKAKPQPTRMQNALTLAMRRVITNYMQLANAAAGGVATKSREVADYFDTAFFDRAMSGAFSVEAAEAALDRINELGEAVNGFARDANSGREVDPRAFKDVTSALYRATAAVFTDETKG